jgi:NAD(P)-dependent dehydrogenase (short-subunit alcohol dehydrogenase family)
MPTTTGKKIAIVTGSALGLGYELASQLIANGWLVAGVDFNAERQAELTAQWPDDSYRAYVGDITDEAFVICSSTTPASLRSRCPPPTRPPTSTNVSRDSKA